MPAPQFDPVATQYQPPANVQANPMMRPYLGMGNAPSMAMLHPMQRASVNYIPPVPPIPPPPPVYGK